MGCSIVFEFIVKRYWHWWSGTAALAFISMAWHWASAKGEKKVRKRLPSENARDKIGGKRERHDRIGLSLWIYGQGEDESIDFPSRSNPDKASSAIYLDSLHGNPCSCAALVSLYAYSG